MDINLNRLARQLWPYLQPLVEPMLRRTGTTGTGTGGGVVGGAPSPHALNSSHHTGTLGDGQAPQFLKTNGSRQLTGNLGVAPGVTIDGVDLSAHAANADAHHNQATAGDGIQLTGQQVAVNTTVVRTTRQVISGDGLTGGGNLSADRTLAVGAGTLITVAADSVGVTPGANYQFVGTGAGTAAGWRNVSELAGDGLTATNGVLAVGVANSGAAGLTVEANAVRLTSSSNPGAAASVLATAASGSLQLVTLASNAAFVSGFAGAGYRIDYGITEAGKASAEFDNLTVRGRMRVYELLIQQIRATNGSVFVASASRAEQVTSVGDLWTVNGTQLTFNGNDAEFAGLFYRIQTRAAVDDDSRDLYHGFLTGDIVRSQRFALDSNGGFASVRQSNLRVGTIHSLWEYTAHWCGGDVPVVGDDLVRLGSDCEVTRQGALYLTADDSNAPYMDIVDGITAHADWNTPGKAKVRLGKLTGITDSDFGGTLSGYGLYANNVYLKGQIVVTGGNALTTGGAAADINANTTTIDGGKITTDSITATQIAANTITADRLNVTSLSAITANMGALTIDGLLTVGTSGEIRQGTGTLGSNFTGLRVWRDTNVGRIAGYDGDTQQWYAGTDGKLYAGGGTVVLDANGMTIRASTSYALKNAVTWVDGSNNEEARVWGKNGASQVELNLDARPANTASVRDAVIRLQAIGRGVGALAQIYLTASNIYADGELKVYGSLVVDGDTGGQAGTVGLTDVSNTAANSTGTGTIKFKGATNRDSAGFIKIYIGTTAYYVPVFAAITG